VQTLASFLLPRRIHLPPPEERLVEVAPAGVARTLVNRAGVTPAIVSPAIMVRCQCYWQSERKEDRAKALTAIVVHGLEGSSDSEYMTGVAEKALAAGMNVVLMNQRNCGGMDHVAPTLYNSSLSGDVAAVARHVVENDGVSRFALIGFSMGGNLVLKLAGEWGNAGPAEFRAVAAVCPAMDLAASADALHEPANRIYEWYFCCSCSGGYGERRSFSRKTLICRGSGESPACACLMTGSRHTTAALPEPTITMRGRRRRTWWTGLPCRR